ncbi:Ribosomal protein S27a [Macleaya cordata]|uniref:Ribosomal protein S27a n=1 Tax=Macleaya cordata TaxID=56857 RepID=A0A200QSX6_MACCD|nr:Ribosomal protein S27a [Macleaya cordata]
MNHPDPNLLSGFRFHIFGVLGTGTNKLTPLPLLYLKLQLGTYTKPKKIKHKHKKVKLALLQFYKVDDSGKVQKLRKECPNSECGAGTFMANHFDRHYCGKCGLTYVYQKAGGE